MELRYIAICLKSKNFGFYTHGRQCLEMTSIASTIISKKNYKTNTESMMNYITPDLCDEYPDLVTVAEPLFNNYGGNKSFGGRIVTIKCFEDNSLVKETASKPGNGKVIVIDGGGSLRRSLLGDMIARSAFKNGWEGFIIYGAIRDIDVIGQIKIGVKALNTIPLKTEKKGIGEYDKELKFAGIVFRPGEYVYADNNGIIVSPEQLEMPDQ